jgi:hypothetical protein
MLAFAVFHLTALDRAQDLAEGQAAFGWPHDPPDPTP